MTANHVSTTQDDSNVTKNAGLVSTQPSFSTVGDMEGQLARYASKLRQIINPLWGNMMLTTEEKKVRA